MKNWSFYLNNLTLDPMHCNVYQWNGGAERIVASRGFLGQKQGLQPMGGGLEQEPR